MEKFWYFNCNTYEYFSLVSNRVSWVNKNVYFFYIFLITILFLAISLHLRFFVFFLPVKILSPYLEVSVSSTCVEICGASSQSATITWLTANRRVLMFSFLEHFIPFISSSFHSVAIWFTYMYKLGKGAAFWSFLINFYRLCQCGNICNICVRV